MEHRRNINQTQGSKRWGVFGLSARRIRINVPPNTQAVINHRQIGHCPYSSAFRVCYPRMYAPASTGFVAGSYAWLSVAGHRRFGEEAKGDRPVQRREEQMVAGRSFQSRYYCVASYNRSMKKYQQVDFRRQPTCSKPGP